jgi:hypothetical protein
MLNDILEVMYLSWAVLWALGIVLYYLYLKIKHLEKKSGELGTAKLVVRAKNAIYDLPIIKAHAGVNEKYLEVRSSERREPEADSR